MVGGVCAGLARYMDLRPLPVRLTFVLFGFLTWGWALLAYIIFWIKIPAGNGVHVEGFRYVGRDGDVDLVVDPALELLANSGVWIRHGIHLSAG